MNNEQFPASSCSSKTFRCFCDNTKRYRLVYIQNSGNPRACVIIKTSINALLLYRFSEKNTVTMVVEINSVTLWSKFLYLAHDYGLSPSGAYRSTSDGCETVRSSGHYWIRCQLPLYDVGQFRYQLTWLLVIT